MRYLDCETFSACDLRRCGGHVYAADETTELLCAVMLDDRTSTADFFTPGLALPGDALAACWPQVAGLPPAPKVRAWSTVPPHWLECADVAAWNADGFEAPLWRALGLPDMRWHDLIHYARLADPTSKGFSLDAVGERLIGVGKDTNGAALIERYSMPQADGARIPFDEHAAIGMLAYCARDVALEYAIAERIADAGDMTNDERALLALHSRIDARGIPIDQELSRAVQRFAAAELASLETAALAASGGYCPPAVMQSPQQFAAYLARRGFILPDLRDSTLRAVLLHPDTPRDIATLLLCRIGISRKSNRKIDKLLAQTCPDSRVRGQLVYYGAHTGRWTGRGAQVQNLPRGAAASAALDLDSIADRMARYDGAIVGEAIAAGIEPGALYAALLRPCVAASPGNVLLVADFASIEARGACWLADDAEGLRGFSGDPYLRMAERVYGADPGSFAKATHKKERQIGKTIVLGCGYGMGVDTFARRAALDGIDLDAAGVTALQCVQAWRDAHPAIAGERSERGGEAKNGLAFRRGGVWKALGAAIKNLATGASDDAGTVARCDWRADVCPLDGSRRIVCRLPSGRELLYPGVRIEKRVPAWDADGLVDTVVYGRGKGHTLYGGKALENICQAVCRDLLGAAMLRLDAAGYAIVLHVHDEIVCEAPELGADAALARMVEIMRAVPAWASGFPVDCEGHHARRFSK